jgi:hypothetical protein
MTRPHRQEQESAQREIAEVDSDVLRMQLPIRMPGLSHVNMVPVIVIDGEVIKGFDQARMESLLRG